MRAGDVVDLGQQGKPGLRFAQAGRRVAWHRVREEPAAAEVRAGQGQGRTAASSLEQDGQAAAVALSG